MRDFLPEDKRARDLVLGKIRETYSARGYQEIETPALEDLARLTSGQGGDNEKLAFRVMKRGAELDEALAAGGELADLGLRYDLTVPLTRYYATNRSKLPKVFKAIQTGPVWRAERPQKGRYRQFIQCDIDIIGDASPLAEIDLLVSSLEALEAITHRKGESNEEYWRRCRENPLALKVKLADIAHNTSSERLEHLPEETRTRLIKKYTRAKEVLLENHGK